MVQLGDGPVHRDGVAVVHNHHAVLLQQLHLLRAVCLHVAADAARPVFEGSGGVGPQSCVHVGLGGDVVAGGLA